MAAGYTKGDLILSSIPYVYVLSNHLRGKKCDYCFQRIKAPKRCSQCRFLYFCNIECQRNAWPDHKEECIGIGKMQPNEPTPSMRLLSRLILKLKKYGHQDPWEMAGTYKRCFADLESHSSDIKQDSRLYDQITFCRAAVEKIIGVENIPPAAEFIEIFGKLTINTFSICDSKLESVGSGLYLGPSIFDHSCDPDAEVVFNGFQLTAHAIRNIPHRDLKRIYISYIDQMNFSQERRKQLFDQYYFTCQCSRCTDYHYDELMTKLLVRIEEGKQTVEHSKTVVERVKQMKKDEESHSALYEVAMDELTAQEGILAPTHLYRVKMLEQVLDSSIILNRWCEAVASGIQLIEPYRLYYHKYHPTYCLLLSQIGKIQLLLHLNKEAEVHLLEAEEAIRISHGCVHPLYSNVKELLVQCQQEMLHDLNRVQTDK